MNFSLSSHEPDCTPLKPCRTCDIVAFLRSKLTPTDFVEFRHICTDVRQKEVDLKARVDDVFELSVRTSNCLKNENVHTVEDLLRRTEAELLRTPNFGRRSLNEIRAYLAEIGHTLGELPPKRPTITT